MEKSKPHYPLEQVKAAVAQRGKAAFTRTALFNALAMGISADVAMGIILTLSRGLFYKSMTTRLDPTLWQDVYHAPCPDGQVAYIKVTLQEGAVVIQFKEK